MTHPEQQAEASSSPSGEPAAADNPPHHNDAAPGEAFPWPTGDTPSLRVTAEDAAQAALHTRQGMASAQDALPAARILVAGPTGVGKSTLINNVFQSCFAQTGCGGAPVTSAFATYGPTAEAPVRLVDTQGLEHPHSVAPLTTFIRDAAAANDAVHVVWYLPGARWQPADSDVLRQLIPLVPVVVVISKCDSHIRNAIDPSSGLAGRIVLRDAIVREFDETPVVFCGDGSKNVSDWEPLACANGHPSSEFELDNRSRTWSCCSEGCSESGQVNAELSGYGRLAQATLYKLPSGVAPAFVTAQRVDAEMKDVEAVRVIRGTVLAMTGIAITPVPFPDLPLLLAAEVYMASRLFGLYNVPKSWATVALFSSVNAVVIGGLGIGAKTGAKLLKASYVGMPVGIVVDMVIAATSGTIIGIGIAQVCSRWPSRRAMEMEEEGGRESRRFQLLVLDAVRKIDVGKLVSGIVRLVLFKDERTISRMIQSDLHIALVPPEDGDDDSRTPAQALPV